MVSLPKDGHLLFFLLLARILFHTTFLPVPFWFIHSESCSVSIGERGVLQEGLEKGEEEEVAKKILSSHSGSLPLWSLPQTWGSHWAEMGLTHLPFQTFPRMLAHHYPRREHMRTLRRGNVKCIALVQRQSGGVCIPAQPSKLRVRLPAKLQLLRPIFACPPWLLTCFIFFECLRRAMHCSGCQLMYQPLTEL